MSREIWISDAALDAMRNESAPRVVKVCSWAVKSAVQRLGLGRRIDEEEAAHTLALRVLKDIEQHRDRLEEKAWLKNFLWTARWHVLTILRVEARRREESMDEFSTVDKGLSPPWEVELAEARLESESEQDAVERELGPQVKRVFRFDRLHPGATESEAGKALGMLPKTIRTYRGRYRKVEKRVSAQSFHQYLIKFMRQRTLGSALTLLSHAQGDWQLAAQFAIARYPNQWFLEMVETRDLRTATDGKNLLSVIHLGRECGETALLDKKRCGGMMNHATLSASVLHSLAINIACPLLWARGSVSIAGTRKKTLEAWAAAKELRGSLETSRNGELNMSLGAIFATLGDERTAKMLFLEGLRNYGMEINLRQLQRLVFRTERLAARLGNL